MSNEFVVECLHHKDNRRRYRRHGLTGETKRRVFDDLFEMQQGRCAICGISDKEIVEQCTDNL